MTDAIDIRGLHYTDGPFAIRGLDLRVPRGSIYGFLGANGAGKTTVIRLMLGLLRPRSGSVTLLDAPMPQGAVSALGRIGYVPEAPHFDPALRIDEILTTQAAFFPHWDADTAETLLGELELDAGKRFGALSKGQKAKVMMLTAIAQQPELLVLDEPTDGLDPVARRDVLALMTAYVAERGATVFMSSHLVHELEQFCTWVGVLDAGTLLRSQPMAEFRAEVAATATLEDAYVEMLRAFRRERQGR